MLERLGYAPWLHEFRDFLGDPRLTLEEFWCKYSRLREQEAPKMKAIKGEADALAFYRSSDYLLWRQIVHRRHSAWRRVLWTMKGKHGILVEVGSGIAPVSSWVGQHRARWIYLLDDLPSRHLDFGHWRLRRLTWGIYKHWPTEADVVTVIDTFEHLPDPLKTAEHYVTRLLHRGFLHWSFPETDSTELDLATAEQRQETIAYLTRTLRTVYDRDGYRVSRKD